MRSVPGPDRERPEGGLGPPSLADSVMRVFGDLLRALGPSRGDALEALREGLVRYTLRLVIALFDHVGQSFGVFFEHREALRGAGDSP